MARGGPVTISDSVAGSLTEKIIPYRKFELESPNSTSSTFKCTDVLVFIIQATLSLETKPDDWNLSISFTSLRPGILFTLKRSNNYSWFEL